MNVALAATYHDPDDRLYDQTERVLPTLSGLFAGVVVHASPHVPERTVELLTGAGVLIQHQDLGNGGGFAQVGQARRAAVQAALQARDQPFVMYCDWDRALHWAEYYPAELAAAVSSLTERDCTVFGRTSRAFASHPRVQRDTESLINQVFAAVSGQPWDVAGAARGLSAAAIKAIVADCSDDSIGTDASWPLFLQRAGGYSLGYEPTEGLEFETADRYGDVIAAAGGLERWIGQLDADPYQWALRLDVARIEVVAMQPYWTPRAGITSSASNRTVSTSLPRI